MKKQLMAGMMAASMALSLAACGGSAASSAASTADSTSGAASTSTAASTSSDEQVTLRFAWWGGDERANATMEVINKFMEENPNIKIEAEYGSSDGYHDKLATQLASGTAADIVQIDPETMPSFVSTGDYFLDYKDYDFDLSNFDPNYIGLRVNGNFDGKQLGLPTGIAGPALVVNEELAEKYGIDFNTQYTWDQFIEWGKQVHEADPDTYLLCTNKEYVTNLVFFTYMKQLTGKTIFEMLAENSDENLFFALRAFCDADHPLAYADITYGCYGVWCGLMHIPSHIIPLKEDFTLDPKDYYGLNQTIVLANPNAPTGIALPRAEIEGILKANPNNVVIVDEAYVDFGGESCVPLIDQYENLLVVQTFSKSRQLAGARLGLAMGNAKLIADLNRVKFSLNPYNINRLTLKAGQAALEDTAYFDRTRAAIVDTRTWTKQQLEQRGFAVLDSRSNFLFASTNRKDGGTLYKELKKNGILVRHFDAPRIQNWLRITIGTSEQMKIFVNTLDKIMEE